ncbi:hypothetical protein B1R32_103174 [Abditibacterium utsteinense]|uniref:Uncharacterized protein n=1 Tax=Abditibacterium utsteinense TaxID=1960156 RepID=A0A2S8SVU4_9BACT|nr:hypothetical protein [Abditibacterium utsteinense]PQV64907.1 hypothetical protein B1R32_103174 [Abditibacterium utsteinense]
METKYRRGIFLAFGVTFALIVAMIVVWKLKFYDDVTAQITTAQTAYDAAKTTGATLDRELKAAAISKENLVLANDQISYFRQRFRSLRFDLRPTPGDGPRNRTWLGYMNEYFSDYGLAMRRQLISAANESGVVLNTSLKVDAPPQVPENIIAPPSGFLKPVMGGVLTVDVTGTLPDILRFLERANRSPILMTVGAIKLEGASPLIKASFTLTPYLVATGPSIELPAVAPAEGSTGLSGTSLGGTTSAGISSVPGGPPIPSATTPGGPPVPSSTTPGSP